MDSEPPPQRPLRHLTDDEVALRISRASIRTVPGSFIDEQVEIQLRLKASMDDFSRTSTRQANRMIWLTVVIALLTVAIAVLTARLVVGSL